MFKQGIWMLFVVPVGSGMGLDAVAKGVRDEEFKTLSLVPVGRQVHRGPSVFVRVTEQDEVS